MFCRGDEASVANLGLKCRMGNRYLVEVALGRANLQTAVPEWAHDLLTESLAEDLL